MQLPRNPSTGPPAAHGDRRTCGLLAWTPAPGPPSESVFAASGGGSRVERSGIAKRRDEGAPLTRRRKVRLSERGRSHPRPAHPAHPKRLSLRATGRTAHLSCCRGRGRGEHPHRTADDTLNGDNGPDTLDGGPGTETLNGGNGTDTCTAEPGETVTSCP
ncbi:hypothetical protein [Streptomyces sp.]|uniref:hypothetical protein n=1 Tax=Streptomyces sp. TaxID=1931 RepID=UPI0039C8C872